VIATHPDSSAVWRFARRFKEVRLQVYIRLNTAQRCD
jgi:hypothetical protein